MTAGELITSIVNYYLSQGGNDALSANTRKKAEFHLQALANKAWAEAPWHFKRTSASIAVGANDGDFDFPANYSGIGTRGVMFVSGQRREVLYRPADAMSRLRNLGIGTATYPEFWSFRDQSAIGLKGGLLYPTNTSALTLLLENYDRRPPIIVDRPVKPSAVAGAAGAYTGTRIYYVTYVTADGETESSPASTAVTVAAKAITVTVPVSPNPKVTSRKLYGTVTGGVQGKLIATLSDNLTATYSDETLDVALGANVPTNATAVTGLELFPAGYHESVFYDGLMARLMKNQGDTRDIEADQDFMKGIRSMWINFKEDRNRVVRMPRYGATAYRQ